MTRDKWRELCDRTKAWKFYGGRWVHVSTFLVPVGSGSSLRWVYARKGSTYRKGM